MTKELMVISHATFEKMQQSSSNTASHLPKIRNSKYKRMAATNDFNLMQFFKTKQNGKNFKKGKTRKRILETRIITKKNKGKKRENGKKIKPSRLKKSILQYRQKKREQARIDEQLLKLNTDFEVLQVGENSENKKTGPPHSSTFREYCNCCKTPDLKKFCEQMLRELNHLQRKAYARNEIKSRAHKRFVIGFRQVQANLHIHKIKLVIIATDCERNEGEVSLCETINQIKKISIDQNIPIVYTFRRREMAYILYKKASISCVGILDYDGVRDTFANVIESLKKARDLYDSQILNM